MENETSRVTTAETAFEIVEFLSDNGNAGVSEIASALGRAKSTIHRHLGTLAHHGYVVKKGGTYSVGLRFLNLGLRARNGRPLYHEARHKVDELAERTGEKVWCITEQNGRSIHLYGASGDQSVRTDSREGQVGYLHQHAAGKAILAFVPRERVEAVIERYGLPARTDRTITDPEELFENLERTRERGYAFNREESIPGLYAIGAPVVVGDGGAIGAISISGPANRLKGDTITTHLPDLLLGAVNEIEINITYT